MKRASLCLFLCLLLFAGCGGSGSSSSPSVGTLSLQAFITLPDGSSSEVSATIDLTPQGGTKEAYGTTPQTIADLPAGTYTIELAFPGFSYTNDIVLQSGETLTLSPTLSPISPPNLPF